LNPDENMKKIVTSAVECENGMPGYLALPTNGGKIPAVIILHERYGYVQHPRDVAERFAKLGMAGLAVNAFFKCDFQDKLADGTKRFFMTDAESVEFLTSAIRLLAHTARVDLDKVAVLGMCQTGRHPLVMAAESDEIGAAICWYGAGSDREFEIGPYFPKPLADVLARVRCPVLGLFAENDKHIPIANVRRIRDALERAGKTFDITIFDDCPHGFLNNTMSARYRHTQSAAAWQVQMNFLEMVFAGAFGGGLVSQRYQAKLKALAG